MSETRFLRTVVLLLLLLNAGTLGFLILRPVSAGSAGQEERMRPREGGGGGPGQFLRRELALTDEQEDQYHELRNAHHERMVALQGQIRRQQQRLYALLSTNDTAVINRQSIPIIDSMEAEQRAIVTVTYDHFREVRALCNPAQQQKFDKVILEALSQLR